MLEHGLMIATGVITINPAFAWFGGFLLAWLNVVTALSDVYGHTMLKTPVLVRSLKLSNIGPR